jgi:hypothetical protein
MAQVANATDQVLVEQMLQGMTIVGPISPSGRWPALLPNDVPSNDGWTESRLKERAWEIRARVLKATKAHKASAQELQKLWEATLEDCDEGSCLGPFHSEAEVDRALGCTQWIPTQRFAVIQKNKVRGCDSATFNKINVSAQISEKLQLPTTDLNVAVIRELRSKAEGRQVAGWVLDERKAYRQVPILPAHRKFSVIVFRHFQTNQLKYFIMIGSAWWLRCTTITAGQLS